MECALEAQLDRCNDLLLTLYEPRPLNDYDDAFKLITTSYLHLS